jgi:hypothetical protein
VCARPCLKGFECTNQVNPPCSPRQWMLVSSLVTDEEARLSEMKAVS